MNRPEHDNVNFFIGTEVEHTPAYGMETLFVVGIQKVKDIEFIVGERSSLLDKSKHITHIYFGANQSFPNPKIDDTTAWSRWENMIIPFLEQRLWCTLDLDVQSVEGLTEGSLTEHALFIPMISVKIPYIKQLGYNATIKLDDKDFQATNPGVWCHSIHDLMDRNKFTSWDLYTKDETIK